MNIILKSIILGIVFVLVAAGLYGYSTVVKKIAYTLTHVPRKTIGETPAKYNTPFTEVTFPSRDKKETLGGWYISQPKNTLNIIIVNGIGDTRANLQRVELASRLTKQGFNILMFDFRGQGTSTGDIASGGFFEQQDLLGAVDFIKQQKNPPQCIGLLAASMGAATSILVAPNEPTIKAIVADSSYADIQDLLTNEITHSSKIPAWSIPFFMPGLKLTAYLTYGINLSGLKPIQTISKIPYPIFFIHGLKDSRIPITQSQQLVAKATKDSELWLVPEAEHANSFAHAKDEYIAKTSDYFSNLLSQPACLTLP